MEFGKAFIRYYLYEPRQSTKPKNKPTNSIVRLIINVLTDMRNNPQLGLAILATVGLIWTMCRTSPILLKLKDNLSAQSVIMEKQRKRYIKPRLSVVGSRFTDDYDHVLLDVQNELEGTAFHLYGLLERTRAETESLEVTKTFACPSHKLPGIDLVESVEHLLTFLQKGQKITIPFYIGSMFEGGFSSMTGEQKQAFLDTVVFKVYIYCRDIEDIEYLTTVQISPGVSSLKICKMIDSTVIKKFVPYRHPSHYEPCYYDTVDFHGKRCKDLP